MKKITYFYAILFGLIVSISSCTVDDLEEDRLFRGFGNIDNFPATTATYEWEKDTVVVYQDPIGEKSDYSMEK